MAEDKKTTALTKKESTVPVRDEITQLIAQAITSNVPVETMERLLAMRKDLKAEKAKEAFDAAMAAFQAECPVIEKKKKVFEKNSDTKVRYHFAPLDDIVEQVKPILGKNGLSYTYKTIQTDKEIGVTCKATHIMGHSEETTFSVPIGSEAFMSEVQKFGARITFAKRYAFCNAFGISTGDEDIDAAEAKKRPESLGITDEESDKIADCTTVEELTKICSELKKKYPAKWKLLLEEYTFRKSEIESQDLADAADKEIGKDKENAK